MPKEKKKADRKKKAEKKGSQLAIRVEKSERDAFVTLCDRLDTSAAREIRRFMREFVAARADDAPKVEAAPAEPAPVAEVASEPPKKAPRKPRAVDAAPAEAETAPAPSRRGKAAAEAPAG